MTFGNCLTSVFAGFVIFSYLGYLSTYMGLPVDEVAKSGPSLTFVVYPFAVTKMPVSPLWAILFFVMLITLGVDSEVWQQSYVSFDNCYSFLHIFYKYLLKSLPFHEKYVESIIWKIVQRVRVVLGFNVSAYSWANVFVSNSIKAQHFEVFC